MHVRPTGRLASADATNILRPLAAALAALVFILLFVQNIHIWRRVPVLAATSVDHDECWSAQDASVDRRVGTLMTSRDGVPRGAQIPSYALRACVV
jgi:hypothetical protein